MTAEQEQARDERLERARAAKAERARKRLLAAEKKVQSQLSAIRDRVDPEDIRKLDYITKEIRSGRRAQEDIEFLQDTRQRILRPYRVIMEDAA